MIPVQTLSPSERAALVTFVGESPASVLAIHALTAGVGRFCLAGTSDQPAALVVESPLVPGEPQGFGDPLAILELLEDAQGWTCIELVVEAAEQVVEPFGHRWGLARCVTDVVHVLRPPPPDLTHPLVRPLPPDMIGSWPLASTDLLPDRHVVEQAAALGRVFVAVDNDIIVGHGSSFAAGTSFADVGVHVAASNRGQGIATCAAAQACASVQAAGLTPVWGAGADNTSSRRVAAKLGFVEIERLVFLVRDSRP